MYGGIGGRVTSSIARKGGIGYGHAPFGFAPPDALGYPSFFTAGRPGLIFASLRPFTY
jgi:hypothetical protein